ncbi:MAG: hypothetical protein AB7U61_06775 [Methylocystis sp.]
MTNNAGYAVHHLKSGAGQAILQRFKLSLNEIDHAIERYNNDGDLRIRTVIGVTNDGLIGNERQGWHPEQPDAFGKGLVIVPWVQILELLGRVPQNTTEQLFESGNTKQ